MTESVNPNEWFADDGLTTLNELIANQIVRTFTLKRDAVNAGKLFGWKDTIRIDRRFERVYIVGKQQFRSISDCHCVFDVIDLPLLEWDGHQQKMVRVRKVRCGESR